MLDKTSQDNQSLASKSLELQDETFKFLPEQLLQDENFKKPFSDKIIKEVEAKTDHGKATVVEEPADQEPMLSRPRREKVKPGQALVLVEEVPASRIPTKSDSSEFFEDIEVKEKQALSMLNEVKAKRDKKRQADSFEVASESKKLKMVVVDDELKEKEVEKAAGERENVQVVILDEEKLKKKEEKKQRKAEKRKQREEAKKEEEQQRKTEEKARRKAEKKRRKEEKRKGEEEEQTERSKRQKEASNKVENLEGEIFERLERNQVLPSEGDEQLEQEPGENLQEQEEKGEKENREEEEEKKKIETEKEKRDKEERKKQEEVRRKEEERVKNREEKEKEEKLNRLETELKKKKEKQGQNQGDTDNAVEENEGSNLENSEAKGIQEYMQSSGKALALQDSYDTNLDLSVPAKESHNGVHSPISSGALEVSNVGAIPISLSTLIPTIGLASVSI